MTPPKDRLFLCADCYKGEWNDYYFENEHFDENEIKSWIELTEVRK